VVGSGPPLTWKECDDMFYVYILKSKQDEKLYVGCTSDLKKRFFDHNKGLIVSTKPRRPFIVIYYEAYLSHDDAFEREHQLKRFGGSMTHLKKRIKKSLVLSR